ncbi:sensor histidine kinase [Aquimarina sp. AU119]|uniref:sensor histidine kinase n=1 Tax=Aquimarina sp. AU119 TaxID=2108528 RepID=UPI000D693CAB|nr:sensor histidine kinase [Aquimarina sp. AU119]
MNALKRFFYQTLLWLIIWSVLWFGRGFNSQFLAENSFAFAFQALLIGALIYYIAPMFLFKKKYVLFLIISILGITTLAFISINLFTVPKIPPPFGGGPKNINPKPPSRFFIHFLLLSISYVIAVFIETFVFAQKKEQETIKNKNENLQTELKLLKSQINPHFLFNSLNNIYALSVIDSNKTQQSIGYLSDMLRYVLYECERPLVPLKKEVSYIKDYIKLFSLKSSKAYAITTDFSILDGNTWIAPMLLIPFVENAFKHSNIEKPKDSFIKIQIQSTPNYINFKIENSIPKKRINKDIIGGIGLENVKKRLAILYPENHQLDIIENNEVFKVKLNIKQTNNA